MKIEGAIAVTGTASHLLVGNETNTRADRERVQQEKLQQNVAAHPDKQNGNEKAAGDRFLASAIQQTQEILHAFDEQVSFDIHRETNATIVRVVNHSTGEVVREIPAEKFLDMLASFQKQLNGLFVDELQ